MNMALAINIEDLLNKQKIESNRIKFKKGWNPASIYHSICAFANDFDDLGGSETKDMIIEIITQNPHVIAAEIAMQLSISSRGAEKQKRKLREAGVIKRIGGRYGGYQELGGEDPGVCVPQ